ncbi:MAG: hypothetical protein IH586_08675 [Anaerolineaceae bacterium]|nr:hypothetical protein [Anaerolineaceae bacterium]
MDELREMIELILRRFRRPYPQDITDQVFLTIERDQNFLRDYHFLADGDYATLNQMIGKYVEQITRLKVKGHCNHPESTLIKSYSILV